MHHPNAWFTGYSRVLFQSEPPTSSPTPEFDLRLVEEHRAAGSEILSLPDGSSWVFPAGTPRHYIDRQVSPTRNFRSYEEWKAANVYQWPTTRAGQEEARRRTEAMWATNPDPHWKMLIPPFCYTDYGSNKHRQYFLRFAAERAAAGDIVVDQATVYAIGTPEWVIAKGVMASERR
jgi:hypothetical protein